MGKFMDELRTIRCLGRQIQSEYNVENASDLAEILVNNGITEITDNIREKIHYLQNVCEIVNLDDYWVSTLVGNYTLDEIKARYEFYRQYAGKEKCKADNLALTCKKGNAYLAFFIELGFNDEQINSAMRKVVEIGSIVKSEKGAREIVGELDIFGVSNDERNQFISDNADFLFNDYSGEVMAAWQLFENLCQRFGRDGGFACLIEHPEYLRFGVEEKTLRDKVLDYLYDDEAIFSRFRDCNFEKPDGTEILLEFAKEVRSRVNVNDAVVTNDLMLIVDIVWMLMEFAQEAEWAHSIASEMRKIIMSR